MISTQSMVNINMWCVSVLRPVRIAMCDGSSSEVLAGVVSTGVGSRSMAAAVNKRLSAATPVDCG